MLEKKKDEMEKSNPKIIIENRSFKPKAIAQRCPVCNGFGTLKYGEKTCQACDGKGYLLVPTIDEKGRS